MNYRKVAEGNDTVLLRWPFVPSPDPSLVEDLGWREVAIPFPLEEAVKEVTSAKVVIWLELTPGSDWHVKTDGSSGLKLNGG